MKIENVADLIADLRRGRG